MVADTAVLSSSLRVKVSKLVDLPVIPKLKASSELLRFLIGSADKDETLTYVDEMRGGKNNVLVSVRVRPLSRQEQQNGHFNIVNCIDEKIVLLYDPQEVLNQGGQLYEFQSNQIGSRGKEKQYAFDYVFDKHAGQESVFEKSVKFALDGVLDGFNATVFAYGATGAGKTYTMLGTEDSYGLMGLTFLELFKKIDEQKKTKEFKILMSYLEIYNENIRDLLIQSAEKTLDLREDSQKGIIINGLTEVIATSVDEVMTLLRIGNKNRSTEATNANETSSRSHAILQVIIEYKDRFSGTETEINFAKLSLIDLAGSERASSTQNINKGTRMLEGAAINKSLLALGNCITALANQKPGEKPYIPYRDSKLTRLLKDSLGGNCRTVMIANISPSSGVYEDTHNTLIYANRAKKIKNKMERNVLNVNYHIGKYSQIISQLKQELADTKLQLQQKSLEGNASMGFFGSMKSIPGFDKYKSDLRQHFEDETRLKMQIIENEKRIDEIGFTLLKLKNEANQKTRDLGKGHLATKKVLEEIELNFQHIQENEKQRERFEEQLSEFVKKRDNFPQIWKNSNEMHGGEMPQAHLNLMLKYEIMNQEILENRRREDRQNDQNKLNEMQLKYLQEQIFVRDNIIEKAKALLKHNQIKFTQEDDYDVDGVYDMLENAETSFPLLKISRSVKLLKRRDSRRTNKFEQPQVAQKQLPPAIHVSQTPTQNSQKASMLPPISQTPNNKSIALKMMENKRSRMDNFSSRSVEKKVLQGSGLGFLNGSQGPNIVVQKLNDQTNPQTPSHDQPLLRTVQSQQIIYSKQDNNRYGTIDNQYNGDDQSTIKKRPTIILKPKDNKPYLLIKTTRAKEEEKQRNQLGSILYPQAKSQSTLKYQRAFKSVVEGLPNNTLDRSLGRIGTGSNDSNSLTRSDEISMYNTDNTAIKHIYSTKSLITQRLANSPYLHTPAKRGRLEASNDKPWRTNMSTQQLQLNSQNNKNFVESAENRKFLNMLQKDVEINQNHIQSLKRKIVLPKQR